jgi:mannitol-specific phosphotransferase system IIBC component
MVVHGARQEKDSECDAGIASKVDGAFRHGRQITSQTETKQINVCETYLQNSDKDAEIGIVTTRSESRFCQNNKQIQRNVQNESHRGKIHMVESITISPFASICDAD